MILQQDALDELRRKGRPLDTQWQGVEGRSFAGGMERRHIPLMLRPKRLEFSPPESASQKRIKAYKATLGTTLDEQRLMQEGRMPRLTVLDAQGGKRVFKSAVEWVTTVLDILEANTLPPLNPVRTPKPIPTLTAAQKVWKVARVKFAGIREASRMTLREDHQRQLNSLPKSPIGNYDPQRTVNATPQPWMRPLRHCAYQSA